LLVEYHLALADRFKDDFLDTLKTCSDYERGKLEGQLQMIDEFIGIPLVIKQYETMHNRK